MNIDAESHPAALLEYDGHVAVITLNRPEVMNAVNPAMATAVGEFLEAADADPNVRVIVITGSGDRAFCAGSDLKAAASGAKPFATGHIEWGFCGLTEHYIAKPLIAAVNGHALGGGTEIALACDLVVASERARFGLPEVSRGIVAGAGGLVRLPMQVPLKIAMNLALTGEAMSAHDALQWGLVNEVVEHDQTLRAAMSLGLRVAGNAPLAVQHSKRVLLREVDGARPDERLGWELTGHATTAIRETFDAKEGVRAFVEKRKPRWRSE